MSSIICLIPPDKINILTPLLYNENSKTYGGSYDYLSQSHAIIEKYSKYIMEKKYANINSCLALIRKKSNSVYDNYSIYLNENYDSSKSGTIDLGNGTTIPASSGIFFIDSDGTKNYSQARYTGDNGSGDEEFKQYCRAIKKNKSAYEYYKNAYQFSKAVLGTPVSDYTDKAGTQVNSGYGLSNLTVSNADIWNNPESIEISLQTYYGSDYGTTKIFDFN